jgi:hypothetical protein
MGNQANAIFFFGGGKSDYFCGHEKSLPNISSNFNQV